MFLHLKGDGTAEKGTVANTFGRKDSLLKNLLHIKYAQVLFPLILGLSAAHVFSA